MAQGTPSEIQDIGRMQFGCSHYRRRCRIIAPCCNRIYYCHHCHDEYQIAQFARTNAESHEISRHHIEKVKCALCSHTQKVAQFCSGCGVKFGEYFCDICKFYDDDITKLHFHCYDCGICRVGGRDQFFHCSTCGSCYSLALLDNHTCVENAMKKVCAVCLEITFDSTEASRVLKCGHVMHEQCFGQSINEYQKYTCPLCKKSALDMSEYWLQMDEEIEATPMNTRSAVPVLIHCNDCNKDDFTNFHDIGLKCTNIECGSYNTQLLMHLSSGDDTSREVGTFNEDDNIWGDD